MNEETSQFVGTRDLQELSIASISPGRPRQAYAGKAVSHIIYTAVSDDCDRFDVADGELHHRVREARRPHRIVSTLTRKNKFSEDRLTPNTTVGEIQDQLICQRHE